MIIQFAALQPQFGEGFAQAAVDVLHHAVQVVKGHLAQAGHLGLGVGGDFAGGGAGPAPVSVGDALCEPPADEEAFYSTYSSSSPYRWEP